MPRPRIRTIQRGLVSSPVASWFNFNPLSLSPDLWLDAADTSTITESSGSVSQWNDKSGNGRNVTQGVGAAQPTTGAATLNGLNVLTFSGAQVLNGGDILDLGTSGMSMFAVVRRNSGSSNNGIAGKTRATALAGRYALVWAGTSLYSVYDDAADRFALATNTSTSAQIASGVLTRTSAGSSNVLYVNGSPANTLSFTDSGSNHNTALDFTVGSYGEIWFLSGVIGEIVQFQRSLTPLEISAMHNYLARKWGL